MQMTLRWFGTEYDTVSLKDIRQIPGVEGVISTLYYKKPGEVWLEEEIRSLLDEINSSGLSLCGIESVNVHEEIKYGGSKRDEYIDNYITTLENLGKVGIHLVCYNFMPVFDWTRTELSRVRPDGSTVLAFNGEKAAKLVPEEVFASIEDDMNDTVMPGWEKERLADIRDLFKKYEHVGEEQLFDNLVYFLERIMPVCDKYDINMAIHPDDPSFSIFGLPRIINSKKNVLKLLRRVDNPHNGVTFCTGSYGTNRCNDLVDMIKAFRGRIHFAHVRNLKFNSDDDFEEAAHLSADGDFDMYAIVRALCDAGFDGPIRPDHGRMIWGEKGMPGYGLYDRALGATYLNGLIEAVHKSSCDRRLHLTDEGLKDRRAWETAGIDLPEYDKKDIVKETAKSPEWIHFGAGNIFRGFIAAIVSDLIEKEKMKTGIIAVDGFDSEIISTVYKKYDNNILLVVLSGRGDRYFKVISSVTEALSLDKNTDEDFMRVKEIFRQKSLKMATFTITEKGYSTQNGDYMEKIASLLFERYNAGRYPIAMVSLDNCSANGDKLRSAVLSVASNWCEGGFADEGFLEYLKDESRVSFPWSMIDKITPRPDDEVADYLEDLGLADMDVYHTARNSVVAPFVNAEECEYLVVEDKFPNGRPEFEYAGVIPADRETVKRAERMKVCTCLNPLHTCLAIFGCLLGYEKICDEMEDKGLVSLVKRLGYEEGLPVVESPGVIEPVSFLDEVINERFPNRYIPDSPIRIATDTSLKLPIRFGETIKGYINKGMPLDTLKVIPLVYAGWLRYLVGVDDMGRKMELSPDPAAGRLKELLSSLKFGDKDYRNSLKDILAMEDIFGVNLSETGLDDKIYDYFTSMMRGAGAVRCTITKVAGGSDNE